MSTLVKDANGNIAQFIRPDWGKFQTVAVGAASAASSNVAVAQGEYRTGSGDKAIVMIISTTACAFIIGSAPTAVFDSTSIFLPANTYFYLEVVPGTDKIAFIRQTADGTAWIIPAK